jgi:cytochrome b
MHLHQGIQGRQHRHSFHRLVLHRPAGAMVAVAQQQHLARQFGVAHQVQA